MDTRQFYQSSDNSTTRVFNTPSPVVFPSASPTPKLYSTPSQKLPQVKPWQDIGIESVSQNNGNIKFFHDDTAIIHHGEDYHHPNYNHFNDREKPPNFIHTPTISPLSMMMESDTLLDDEDISSYRFSEEDYLSSILSSRPASPIRCRPSLSNSSISPKNQLDEEEPIVGIPFSPVPNEDPIIERPRPFSGPVVTGQTSKLTSFMSRMKKVASGKPSLFK